jgi:hypothetical protein
VWIRYGDEVRAGERDLPRAGRDRLVQQVFRAVPVLRATVHADDRAEGEQGGDRYADGGAVHDGTAVGRGHERGSTKIGFV